MGIVIEYAVRKGEPQWKAPNKSVVWDYAVFGTGAKKPEPNRAVAYTLAIRGVRCGSRRPASGPQHLSRCLVPACVLPEGVGAQ
jgi:hypothetical protein